MNMHHEAVVEGLNLMCNYNCGKPLIHHNHKLTYIYMSGFCFAYDSGSLHVSVL